MNGIAKYLIRFTGLIRWLPDVCTIVILQLAELCQCFIIHDETCVFAIRTLKSVYQVKHIIRLDRSRKRTCYRAAASRNEKAGRFAGTVTVEECILLGICQSLTKLIDDVIFKTEGIIIEKFR